MHYFSNKFTNIAKGFSPLPFLLSSQLLSSQSVQFKKYSKRSDWLEKSQLFKKATFVLIM